MRELSGHVMLTPNTYADNQPDEANGGLAKNSGEVEPTEERATDITPLLSVGVRAKLMGAVSRCSTFEEMIDLIEYSRDDDLAWEEMPFSDELKALLPEILTEGP